MTTTASSDLGCLCSFSTVLYRKIFCAITFYWLIPKYLRSSQASSQITLTTYCTLIVTICSLKRKMRHFSYTNYMKNIKASWMTECISYSNNNINHRKHGIQSELFICMRVLELWTKVQHIILGVVLLLSRLGRLTNSPSLVLMGE